MCKTEERDNSGIETDFAIGIGPYPADCKHHQPCPDCNGTGNGSVAFAIGIGPYPTTCQKCMRKGKISK